ncbi:class I SAM-dependent methyltransferase [Ferruginibacter sp.]
MSNSVTNIVCHNCGSINTALYATASDIEYFTTADPFDYYQCHHCNVLFIHPLPDNELQLIYPANYYSFTNSKGSISFKIKNYLDKLFFKKIFKDINGNNLAILDAGGGTGWLVDSIKTFEPRIGFTQIVDIDQNAAVAARAKGHDYFLGRLEDYNSEKKFHIILLLNFIEHVANPAAIMNKVQSLLHDNGVIIIKTPNYQSLDARIFKNKSWGGYHCPRHWVLFNKASAVQLFRESGLTVKSFSYTQGAPFWTVSILNYLYQKKWIRASTARPLILSSSFYPCQYFNSCIRFCKKAIRTTFANVFCTYKE